METTKQGEQGKVGAGDAPAANVGAALAGLINPEALRQIIVEAARRGDVKVTIPGDVVKKLLGDQTKAAAEMLARDVAVMALEMAKEISRNVTVKIGSKGEPVKIDRPHKQTLELIGILERLRPGMRNCLVVGPAGSGKTHAMIQTAEALRVPHFIQGQTLTRYEFDGFVDAHGVYRGSTFRRFCESEAGGVFGQDEMDGSEASSLLSLNSYLANGFVTFPDGKTFKRTDRHFVVATCNTWGNGANRLYVGRNQLDASTTDRYRKIVWEYDEELEADLVGNAKWHGRVCAVRAAVDTLKLRHTVTPRDAMRGADEIAAGMTLETAEAVHLRRDMQQAEWDKVTAAAGKGGAS